MQIFLFLKLFVGNFIKEDKLRAIDKKFTGQSHHCDCPAT